MGTPLAGHGIEHQLTLVLHFYVIFKNRELLARAPWEHLWLAMGLVEHFYVIFKNMVLLPWELAMGLNTSG